MLPLLPLAYGGNFPLRVVHIPALDIWPCHVTFVESSVQRGWFQTFHITFLVQAHPELKLRYNYGLNGEAWTQHTPGAVAAVPNEAVFRFYADQVAAIVLNACREYLRVLTEALKKINSLPPPKPPGGAGAGSGSGVGKGSAVLGPSGTVGMVS